MLARSNRSVPSFKQTGGPGRYRESGHSWRYNDNDTLKKKDCFHFLRFCVFIRRVEIVFAFRTFIFRRWTAREDPLASHACT